MSTEEGTAECSKPILSVKDDWYQTDTTIVLTLLAKNIRDDQLKVYFSDDKIGVHITVPEFQPYSRTFHLSNKIIADQASYKLNPSKVELKLQKAETIRWSQLEGNASIGDLSWITSYPTSAKGKDWSKIEQEIKKEEEEEKPVNEEAVSHLFQGIYSKGSDEVKKAMNKSFIESGGTVLSTNWQEICKGKTPVKPPEGVEFKKWDN